MSIIRRGISDTDLDVPVTSPTLNLDFANSQKLDPRITFTRGSIGTFVNKNGLIETAQANIPRFDYDPISGECRGLLIEEQRSNIVTNSTTAFFGSGGSGANTTITDGSLAPDGSSANVYIPNSNNQVHTIGGNIATVNLDNIGIAIGATYDITFSAWVKDYNNSDFGVYFVNSAYLTGTPTTNLTYQLRIAKPKSASWIGGSVQTGWTRNYEKVVPYQNGWYRFIQSSRYTRQANQDRLGFSFQIFNNRNAQTYSGDGTSGIYIWGPQVEAGAFETSYIPTTASTVTRSADNASMTGTNFSSWYNSSEGTIMVDCASPTNSTVPVTISDGTTSNRFQLETQGSAGAGTRNFRYVVNGVTQTTASSSYTYYTKQKMIMSYSSNGFSFANAGIFATPLIPKGIPTVNTLRIGANVSNASQNNLPINRLTYYPKALSPSQLQYLTQ